MWIARFQLHAAVLPFYCMRTGRRQSNVKIHIESDFVVRQAIPFNRRVWGPYWKLRTEFFHRSAQAINPRGKKRGSVTHSGGPRTRGQKSLNKSRLIHSHFPALHTASWCWWRNKIWTEENTWLVTFLYFFLTSSSVSCFVCRPVLGLYTLITSFFLLRDWHMTKIAVFLWFRTWFKIIIYILQS